METMVPPVVLVLVTCDPGPAFDETLCALAAQDYPELSVLVLDAGSALDPTHRVAAALPGAYVRRLGENRGFGSSANEALSMVEGAAYLLLCHDDVAPDPNALHLLVEEAYRSNAGIVAPKVVSWDDPDRLLHVGMVVDKGGAVVDRVQTGEIDHGQHDSVRDVFFAPGGFMLVRADLFTELGGFDSLVFGMGEDLDLCWRAQLAGARVVVAPAARVRHLEQLASGRRPVPACISPGEGTGVTLQGLQRRHELHAALKAYGPLHLVRVVPQIVVLAWAEVIVAIATGNRQRATTVLHAWRWNLARLGNLRTQRAAVASSRRLSDAEVRRLQVHGSARLTAYIRRTVAHGLSAHLDAEVMRPDPPKRRESDAMRVAAWVAVAIVVLFGSWQLLTGAFPVMGQIVPIPTWSTMLHDFVSGWTPVGGGAVQPGPPALGFLGVAGMVLFGSVGLLQKVVVLGCIPVGALGMARAASSLRSRRATLAAVVVYLAVPLAYDSLATGRWDGLLAYAAGPWLLVCLNRASGLEPFAPGTASALSRRVLILGVVQALGASMAPSLLVLAPVFGLGLAVGTGLADGRNGWRAVKRIVVTVAGSSAVALALLAPWSIALLAGRGRWIALGGPVPSPGSAPGWGTLLRLGIGPIGDTPLAWAFLVAAALPLVIGGRWRLKWAIRMWSVAIVALLAAWSAGHGWLGSLAVPVPVLLAPAAAGLALAVGLGVSAFESDLSAYRFGWRQGAALVAVVAVIVGSLPVLTAAVGGRWGVAPSGYEEAVSWMSHASPSPFGVLWLGDPRVIPGGSWPIQPGLSYGVSEDGLPGVTGLWPGSSSGQAPVLAADVGLARGDQTVRLGRLLARNGVRYVVVAESLTPAVPGYDSPVVSDPPADLLVALQRQTDLRHVIGQGGYDVYANTAPGIRSFVSPTPPLGARWIEPAAEVAAWVVALGLLWAPLRRRRDRPAVPLELVPELSAA
jgi:GT2 family glycosyltransferase